MKTISVLAALFLTFCPWHLYSQPKGNTISGTIVFPKSGSIILRLCGEEEFLRPEEARFVKVVAAPSAGPGRIAFSFEGLPSGKYALRCYQDRNGNGKLDMGLFGPTEPYGFYKPAANLAKAPQFSDVSFRIDEDMDEILVTLK